MWTHYPWASTPRWGCHALIPVAFTLLLGSVSATAGNLSLREAESIALHQNPGLAALGQKIAELRHQAVAAAQLPDPHLGIGAVNLPINSFSMHQQQMSMLSLGLSQTFPPFGKLGLKGRQKAMEAQSAYDNRLGEAAELLLLLRRVWLDAIYDKEAIQTVQAQERLEGESVKAAMALYRTAQAPQSDVLRAQLAHDSLANNISRLKAKRSANLAQIARILNLPEPPSIENRWPTQPTPPSLTKLETRLTGQPLLRTAQTRARAAQIGVAVAKRNYYPEVTVSADYGEDFYSGSPNWLSVGVNLSLPIFPGDRQDQDVAAARARALQAHYRYDDQRLSLEQQARAYFSRYKADKARLALTRQKLLPIAHAAFSTILVAYSAGRADMSAVLRTQKEVQDYALLCLQYRRDLALSAAGLAFLATRGESQP